MLLTFRAMEKSDVVVMVSGGKLLPSSSGLGLGKLPIPTYSNPALNIPREAIVAASPKERGNCVLQYWYTNCLIMSSLQQKASRRTQEIVCNHTGPTNTQFLVICSRYLRTNCT